MSGITDLETLLASMKPQLMEGEFVFVTLPGALADYLHLQPLGYFAESEGTTLIVKKEVAKAAGLSCSAVMRQISLTVHSSLEAVGLTAAISTKLAEHGISANVVAAYYHDHVFVVAAQAKEALTLLQGFSDGFIEGCNN